MTAEWHPRGCPCEKCPDWGQVPQAPEPYRELAPWLGVTLIILATLTLLAGAMSWYDPNVNFPVISQVVCSFKGATWYGGGILGQPGCYASQYP